MDRHPSEAYGLAEESLALFTDMGDPRAEEVARWLALLGTGARQD